MQEESKESTELKILQKYFKNAKSLKDDYISAKLLPSQTSFKASEVISKDQVVYALGGRVVHHENLHFFDPAAVKLKVMFRESLYSVPLLKSNLRKLLKSSSSPNCGIQDQLFIVAMSDIKPGEEITLDWAMVGGPYQDISGEKSKNLNPEDWKAVADKYGRYCSDFIRRRAKGEIQPQIEEVIPCKISEIPSEEKAVLDNYMYNPEIQMEDFVSVRCEIEENIEMQGFQVRAAAKIPKGRHVSTWGGRVLKDLSDEEDVAHSIQIHQYLHQGPMIRALSQADGINHSCNPNLGIQGTVTLVALRDIEIGQLLSFDYCMTDSDDTDQFDCLCKEPNCRGKVGIQEWKQKEIQDKYAGYFSNYIQRRIENEKK